MRYKATEGDIGLNDDQIRDNLIKPADKVGELMRIAMQRRRQGLVRRRAAGPDGDRPRSSLGSGADWCAYLRTFYRG